MRKKLAHIAPFSFDVLTPLIPLETGRILNLVYPPAGFDTTAISTIKSKLNAVQQFRFFEATTEHDLFPFIEWLHQNNVFKVCWQDGTTLKTLSIVAKEEQLFEVSIVLRKQPTQPESEAGHSASAAVPTAPPQPSAPKPSQKKREADFPQSATKKTKADPQTSAAQAAPKPFDQLEPNSNIFYRMSQIPARAQQDLAALKAFVKLAIPSLPFQLWPPDKVNSHSCYSLYFEAAFEKVQNKVDFSSLCNAILSTKLNKDENAFFKFMLRFLETKKTQ